MSAPNANAVHGKSDASLFEVIASYRFDPKKMKRGKRVAKSAIGPTIAASLALEKKLAITKQKPIVAVENNPMKVKRYAGDECIKTFVDNVTVTRIAITKKMMLVVTTQESQCAQGRTPRMKSVSFIRHSFSSTIDFMVREVGYK